MSRLSVVFLPFFAGPLKHGAVAMDVGDEQQAWSRCRRYPKKLDVRQTQNLSLITLIFLYLGMVYAEQLTKAELSPAHGLGDHKLIIVSEADKPQAFWNFWVAEHCTYIRCDPIFTDIEH